MFDSLGTNRTRPNADGNFRQGGKKAVTNSNYTPSSPTPNSARSNGSNRGSQGSNGASIVYNSPTPAYRVESAMQPVSVPVSGMNGMGGAPYVPNAPSQPTVDASHIHPTAPACAKDVFVLSQQVMGSYQHFQTLHGFLEALSGFTQQGLGFTQRAIHEQVQNGVDSLSRSVQQQIQLSQDNVMMQVPQICESICHKIIQQAVQPMLHSQNQAIQDLEYKVEQQQNIISKEFQNVHQRVNYQEQEVHDHKAQLGEIRDLVGTLQNTTATQMQDCFSAISNGDALLQQQQDSAVPMLSGVIEEKFAALDDKAGSLLNSVNSVEMQVACLASEETKAMLTKDLLLRADIQEHKVDGIIREMSVMYDKVQKLHKYVLLGSKSNKSSDKQSQLTDIYGDGVSITMEKLFVPAEEASATAMNAALDEYSGFSQQSNMEALLGKVSEMRTEMDEFKRDLKADYSSRTLTVDSKIVDIQNQVEGAKVLAELTRASSLENVVVMKELIEQGKKDMTSQMEQLVSKITTENIPVAVSKYMTDMTNKIAGLQSEVKASVEARREHESNIDTWRKTIDTQCSQTKKEVAKVDSAMMTRMKEDITQVQQQSQGMMGTILSSESRLGLCQGQVDDLQKQIKALSKSDSIKVIREEMEMLGDGLREHVQQLRTEVESTRYDLDNMQLTMTNVTRRASIANSSSSDSVGDGKVLLDRVKLLEQRMQQFQNDASKDGPPDSYTLTMLDKLREQVSSIENSKLVVLSEKVEGIHFELNHRVDNVELDIAKLSTNHNAATTTSSATNTIITEQQKLQKQWQDQFLGFETLLGQVTASMKKQEDQGKVLQENMDEQKEQQCSVQIEVEEAGLLSGELVEKIKKLTADVSSRPDSSALLREELGVVRADVAYLQRLVQNKPNQQKPQMLPKDTRGGSTNSGLNSLNGSLASPQHRTGGGYKM